MFACKAHKCKIVGCKAEKYQNIAKN